MTPFEGIPADTGRTGVGSQRIQAREVMGSVEPLGVNTVFAGDPWAISTLRVAPELRDGCCRAKPLRTVSQRLPSSCPVLGLCASKTTDAFVTDGSQCLVNEGSHGARQLSSGGDAEC